MTRGIVRRVRSSIVVGASAILGVIGLLDHGFAQFPGTPTLKFDVASIRPNTSSPGGGRGGPPSGVVRYTPGRVTAVGGATVRRIITWAYHLTDYQVIGGPSWIDTDKFDLDARAATPADEDQLRAMMQSLLAERFSLGVHHEGKEMRVYTLVVGKKGAKLTEVKPGEPLRIQTMPAPAGAGPGGYHVFATGTMQGFAYTLSGVVDRPVIDKTGLPGTYLLNLAWDEDESITTAIQDEFGLKLEPQRATVDVIYVDHVEKPSEN